MTTKVLVGIPARDTVMTGFAHSLAAMAAVTAASELVEVRLHTSTGTLIADQRAKIAKEAVDSGADWLLMIDSDMRFPADALLQMLTRNVPIVAANYTTRRAPPEPVAFKRLSTAEKLWTLEDSTGLEECAGIGMGLFLVHTDVLKAMDKPWFNIPYLPETDGWWGEDVWFCNQARKAGFATMLDHDLSKQVKHIGQREYDYRDAEEFKDEVQAMWEAGQCRSQRSQS